MIKIILALSALLVCSVTALAGDCDICAPEWGVSCAGMRISVCPAGDFEYISDGCGSGSDYIWVTVLCHADDPIVGIPVTDFWLGAADPAENLCLCTYPITADSVTGSNGRTTFSGRISGGGCMMAGMYMVVQGKTIIDSESGCVDIQVEDIVIVSPDLNADCVVNLSDLAVFGLSYNKDPGDAGYDPCCDYNDDDRCNLSDFAWIGYHYLHSCE